ncbi:VOC family protein [Chryseobacterium sp. JK1]|uniref:VOC family protein n=1 Tax=Chryseobacterium sp. JK1 TaxID=874294 RepID=UPI003D686B11
MNASNPVVYFEIPVNDLKRAEKFYSAVFNFTFEKEIIDQYEMAMFPFEEKKSGITGALAKGDVYKPSKYGIIIYFKTKNIDETLDTVLLNGGKILYPKKIDEKYGFAVAEFEDSEGNRIALHETVSVL